MQPLDDEIDKIMDMLFGRLEKSCARYEKLSNMRGKAPRTEREVLDMKYSVYETSRIIGAIGRQFGVGDTAHDEAISMLREHGL
jgi:hypothetical protein